MKMKKWTTLIAAVLLTMTSCNKELFDKEVYDESVEYQFMVDNADPNHNWCLTKNDTLDIQVSKDIYSVQILTDNPYTSTSAEIAAEGVCYNDVAKLCFTIPITQSNIYVAALDNQGNYLGVVSAPYNIKTLELSNADLQNTGTLTDPTYQTFTYIYDCNFPEPGTFDYNDMVLRISKKTADLPNPKVVDLYVTLEACGASQLYAAAVQLAGISYDDIEKVEIVGGEAMDADYPLQRQFITDGNVLQKARNGNAVISLFECAQWAMSKKKDEMGDIAVIKYNVTHTDVENQTATVDPVIGVFRITFKDRDKARSLTFDRIDPFIVHTNKIGGYCEVHTYAYKFNETLRELYYGQESAYDNHISWALVIPKSDFRYPIEGMSLANYNETTGETFGPYKSFVGWMKNQYGYRNWYNSLDYKQFVY